MKEFEEDLDLRSKWMGLRMLRKGYSQAPYHRKNKGGKHIPMGNRAEEAATYLSETQWKPEQVGNNALPTNKIITAEVIIRQDEISKEEIEISTIKNSSSDHNPVLVMYKKAKAKKIYTRIIIYRRFFSHSRIYGSLVTPSK